MRLRLPLLLSIIALVPFICLAGKEFVRPTASPAKTYPAHDEHPSEHIAVGADPYDMADKAQIFSVNYHNEGFLPILLVVTNDGDQPVSLKGMNVQLVTVNRTKLSPATSDDLYRRLSHPSQSNMPSPLPLPRKKVKGGVSQKAAEEIDAAQFQAKAVEPHSTQSGFIFFDVEDISTPLAGANLYLTGIKDAGGHELMYFEIPMEKYLSAPQAKP
jgi:hypothetical protein